MEQGIVSNNSNELVTIHFGGLNYYFDPEQERVFAVDLAQAIAGEDDRLSFVAEEPRKVRTPRMRKEEVAPEPEMEEEAPAPIVDHAPSQVAAPDYSAKEAANGRILYMKNGKMISKEEYDARPRS